MKQEELTPQHIQAASDLLKGLYGKRNGEVVEKDDTTEDLNDEDIQELLSQISEEEWDGLDQQLQTQYAKKGAKLNYIKKLNEFKKKGQKGIAIEKGKEISKTYVRTEQLKKGGETKVKPKSKPKCKCGCDMVDMKEKGGVVSKCACGCNVGKTDYMSKIKKPVMQKGGLLYPENFGRESYRDPKYKTKDIEEFKKSGLQLYYPYMYKATTDEKMGQSGRIYNERQNLINRLNYYKKAFNTGERIDPTWFNGDLISHVNQDFLNYNTNLLKNHIDQYGNVPSKQDFIKKGYNKAISVDKNKYSSTEEGMNYKFQKGGEVFKKKLEKKLEKKQEGGTANYKPPHTGYIKNTSKQEQEGAKKVLEENKRKGLVKKQQGGSIKYDPNKPYSKTNFSGVYNKTLDGKTDKEIKAIQANNRKNPGNETWRK